MYILSEHKLFMFKYFSFVDNIRANGFKGLKKNVLEKLQNFDIKFQTNQIKNMVYSFYDSVLFYYIPNYLNLYYTNMYLLNSCYVVSTSEEWSLKLNYVSSLTLISKFFKFGLILFLAYTIFSTVNFYNYITQLVKTNILSKTSVYAQSEKELGSTDEMYIFALLFLLTVSVFIFSSIFYFLFNSSFFNLLTVFLVYLIIVIVTVPLNLLIDFNLYFFTYIRGCASGNNFIKEFIFDLISSSIMFIRFIIQNIRFLFIFLATFELLEWSHSCNSNVFFFFNVENDNFLFNLTTITNVFNCPNNSIMIVNLILFIISYFYYILHLLFLLIVQIIAYVGILLWLFFFLYSVRFTKKMEKSFMFYKK